VVKDSDLDLEAKDLDLDLDSMVKDSELDLDLDITCLQTTAVHLVRQLLSSLVFLKCNM